MVEMDVGTRLMVFGENALANLPSLIDRALRQQHDNLTELRIEALTY